MNKFEKLFTKLVNEGVTATERIQDAEKKGMVCAALAQAIADSGLMTTSIEEADATPAEEATGKDSLKEAAGKGKAKTKAKTKTEAAPAKEIEKIVEEIVEEIAPVVEDVIEEVTEGEVEDVWSEEMQVAKKEELETLNAYIDSWTEDFVCRECLSRYMEDASITADQLWDHIRPTNIAGFIAYLVSISE